MAATIKTVFLKPAEREQSIQPYFKVTLALRLVRIGFSSLGRLFPKQASKLAYRLFATPRFRARHKVSDKILAKAKVHDFLYGEQLLKAYEWGSGEKIILLVHGWESRGTALRSFVPELLEKGYKVVAFDAPAHGNSGGKQTNLPNFAGAIVAAIHHFGKIDGIITHSFGGSSTVFALAALDNTIAIDKLVMIGVPTNLLKEILGFLKMIWAPPVVQKDFLNYIQTILNRPIETVDVSLAYDQVNVNETLIVHDKSDQVVPYSNAERIVSRWNNASLLVSEGYGHFRLMKNPELIKHVVTFLCEEEHALKS